MNAIAFCELPVDTSAYRYFGSEFVVLPARIWSFRLLVAAVATLLVGAGVGWSAPARAADPLTDEVTVVMAVPAGGTQDSTTLQQVVDAVNGPVADYWNRQSGGAIRIGVTRQVDWYQSSFGCSDPSGMFTRRISEPVGRGPTGSTCCSTCPPVVPAAGRSTRRTAVTCTSRAGSGSRASARRRSPAVSAATWAPRGPMRTSATVPWTRRLRHRLARRLLRRHGCRPGPAGVVERLHAAKLGVLPAQQQAALSMSDAPTTVTLAPVSGATGVRAISLTVPGGAVYWLEYRPASGQDAWLGTAANTRGIEPGVLLRMSMGGSPRCSSTARRPRPRAGAPTTTRRCPSVPPCSSPTACSASR